MPCQRSGWIAAWLGWPAVVFLCLSPATGAVDRGIVGQSPPGQTRVSDAALSGRILDPDGVPLAGAVVQALRPMVEGGRRVLSVVAETSSDPDGGFQLRGLRAGRYVVRAFGPGSEAQRGQPVEPAAPTYYPGVSAPEAAAAVRAGASLESELLPFRLRHGRPVRVRGRLTAHNGRPLLSAAVIMSPGMVVQGGGGEIAEARIEPSGEFVFRGVPPGGYFIRARGQTTPQGASLYSTFRLVVEDRDVSGVEMVLAPGGVIAGQLSLQPRHGSAPPPLESLRVRAPLDDGSPFGDPMTGAVAADGSFRLLNVAPGSHVIMVEGLTHPWRIADARLQGRNIVEAPFDVDRDRLFEDLRILVTDTAAGVSGTVNLPEGTAATEVLVVAFPFDALQRRVPLRYVRAGHPAPDGGYRVLDLAPGEYLVVAAMDMTAADALDGDALDRLAPLAARVVLQEAKVASLPLDVVRFPGDPLP